VSINKKSAISGKRAPGAINASQKNEVVSGSIKTRVNASIMILMHSYIKSPDFIMRIIPMY
jgi:hypothetical protein